MKNEAVQISSSAPRDQTEQRLPPRKIKVRMSKGEFRINKQGSGAVGEKFRVSAGDLTPVRRSGIPVHEDASVACIPRGNL
jgi:hypothetical protein